PDPGLPGAAALPWSRLSAAGARLRGRPGQEGSGDDGRAEKRGPWLEHQVHGDRGHHLAEPPLVAKRPDEDAVLELGPDLPRDPAADADAADCKRLEGQVAGLGAIDRHERVERLDGPRVAP